MSDDSSTHNSLEPAVRSRRQRRAIARPSPEREAIVAGVRADDMALARAGTSGVLMLFTDVRQAASDAPRAKALRLYAELQRALLPRGYDVPATSLVAAGFTAAQIARIDVTIAAIT